MKIKNTQPDIIVKHNNPTFEIEFKELGEEKEVSDEIGKLLIKMPQIEEVKEVDRGKEREKRKSSFKQLE